MIDHCLPLRNEPLNANEIAGLAMALPDSIILVDSSFRVIWANHSAERLFDRTLAGAAGMDALELIHPDDVDNTAVSMTSVLEKTVGTPIEIRVLTHDGWRLVEMIGAPCGNDVIVSLRDLTDRRRWEVAHSTDARFRSLIHNASMLTMLVDSFGTVQNSSAALTRLLGHDQEWIEGRGLEEIIESSNIQRWNDALVNACHANRIETGSALAIDLVLRKSDGSTVPFAITIKNLLDDPTVNGLVVSGHDISDRVAAARALRSANSVLAATLESTADGILVVGENGRIVSFNRRFAEMWKIPAALFDHVDHDLVMEHARAQLCDPEVLTTTLDNLHADLDALSHDLLEFRDGRLFEHDSLPQCIDGEIVGRVSSFRDVTEDRLLREELRRQALHDSLTGLPNKKLFRERVENAAARMERNGDAIALLFIDIDDFKNVNDNLGHCAGDILLKELSSRLKECLRPNDTAARLGGDEFAVLIEDLGNETQATDIAERIVTRLQEPIVIESKRITVGASVGVAFGRPGVGLDGSALLRNADRAMYMAKGRGKSCVQVFSSVKHDHTLTA